MKLERVAVIGAGIMGGHIATFFANLGIGCDIFDIDRAIAEKMLHKMADPTNKIPMLYTARFAKRVQPHALSEMDKFLPAADLIVEAIPEKMELKIKTFAEVAKYRKPDSVVATNTSGLSVHAMAKHLPEAMSRCFLGTHFFNPVRYMALVEIIPGPITDPKILEAVIEFLEKVGKKTVICRDTPNFIANRIGLFTMMKTISLMEKYQMAVETIDQITGPAIGNPGTATLRLCDMVGLDTTVDVANNVYQNCPNDEQRNIFKPPKWLERMVAEKMLGEKTGKGFYQKVGDQIQVLDIDKWNYRPQKKVKLAEVEIAKDYSHPGERIRLMCTGETPVHQFARELILATAAYSLNRIGEITDTSWTIDAAMKLGFKREIGPIELLDSIGLETTRDWMEEFKIPVPPVLNDIIATTGRIYKSDDDKSYVYAPEKRNFAPIPQRHQFISLEILKNQEKIVRANLSSRLIDLGDGVLLLELDHKMVPSMNPVDNFVMDMMAKIPQVMQEEGFKALVIGNQAANFCAGAQLQIILEMCKEKAWKKIEMVSAMFQKANMALYHAPFPVIVAPHGMTLGGGMEISLAGHKRVALAEFYGGLVEVGVGLLPGAAGNLLLLLQFMETMEAANPGPVPPMRKAFELIAYGTVSTSAYQAMELGLLKQTDVVVFNKDEQISCAKDIALGLVGKLSPRPKRDLYLPGPGGYVALEAAIEDIVTMGKLTPHGALIAKKQAYVLTGGDKASPASPISEEYFLELERQAFASLCGEPKSQERIGYMLKNKKPLIN